MATEADYVLLREDTGVTEAELSDAEAEAIFVLVEAEHGDNASAVYAGARVTYLRRRLAFYSTQASYRQNEESENLSDVFKHLRELLDYWQAKLDDALVELPAGRRPMFFGLAKAGRRWGWR